MSEAFRKFAKWISEVAGTAWTFVAALLLIVVWAATGPLFGYSDTWQLVINTGTTIITFLMVFLIQNTQNRDSKAIHLKLDELIRSIRNARDSMLNLEDLSDEELQQLHSQFESLRKEDGETIHSAHKSIIQEIEERKASRGRKH